ncbi:unnamed protein product [Sphagnum jensenii]|uniref:ACB domain-containing protein n=1 Tax=Sphagnum jensenii TaxID=128206 RepID=A0ABP0XAD2_9BRYO
MATADWQEAVQASFLGLMFAFMVAKLVSLVFSFWGKNLRVECAPVTAAARSFTTVDDGELTPADEFNAPLASWPAGEESAAAEEEEEEEEGHDKQHDRDFDDASSGEDTIETDHHHHLHSSFSDSATDTPVPAARVEEAVFRPDESGQLNEEGKAATDVDFKEELKPLKLFAIDTVATVSEEHPLQALTEGQKEERIKKGIEEEEENETDDWEGVESSELEEQFGAASTYVASMVTLPGVKPSSEAMLQLYAYYKIATEGPCSTSQPSILQPTARAKWNSWQKLGNLPQEEAMQCYIDVLTEVAPSWNQNFEKVLEETDGGNTSSKIGMGPVFSSLAMSEEGVGEEETLEAIHACAREGDLQGLSQLLDLGIPVDLKESHGRTPLIWAADRGQLSAVEILLAKGAEINAQDIEGQTALHYATVCEQEAVAKYLAEHGADAKIADKEGTTPLKLCPPHWAWMQGTPT